MYQRECMGYTSDSAKRSLLVSLPFFCMLCVAALNVLPYAGAAQVYTGNSTLAQPAFAPSGACGTVPAGSGILYCIPLSIDNRGLGIQKGEPINLTLDAANYPGYFNNGMSNIFFYNTTSGNIIASWFQGNQQDQVQTGLFSADTALEYWILLPGGMSGVQYDTNIAIGIGPTTANYYGDLALSATPPGAAPQLYCSSGCPATSYAEYDNGGSVFTFYDNFEGTSLNNNKWNYFNGISASPDYGVNNGITFVQPSSGSFQGIVTTAPQKEPLALDALEVSETGSARMQIEESISNTPCVDNSGGCTGDQYSSWLQYGYGASFEPGSSQFEIVSVGDHYTYTSGQSGTPAQFTRTAMTIEWMNYNPQQLVYAYYQGKQLTPPNYNACTSSNGCTFGNYYLSLMQGKTGATPFTAGSFKVQWIRGRIPPPQGDIFMPITTFGSLVQTSVPSPSISITQAGQQVSQMQYLPSSNVLITATCYQNDPCEINGPTPGTSVSSGSNTVSETVYATQLGSPGIYTFNAVDRSYPSETASAQLTINPGLTISPSQLSYGPYQVTVTGYCGSDSCVIAGQQVNPQVFTGTSTTTFNTNQLPDSNAYQYVITDQKNSLSTTLTLTVLPDLTFSQNPTTYGNTVTVTATCGDSDTCQLQSPLGAVSSNSIVTQDVNTVLLGVGSFTFYGSDLSTNEKQSAVLSVLSPPITCTQDSTATSGMCIVTNDIVITTNTPFSQYGLNGGFSEQSQPVSVRPVTQKVLSYNNNAQWLITCPNTPNQLNTMEYINPTPSGLIGGDGCQVSTSALNSIAQLNIVVTWNQNSVANGNVVLNFTNGAQLSVQNLAYSGESYSATRGLSSANISNGYDSQSNIFTGVPSSAQHGVWSWNSKVADIGNPKISGLTTTGNVPTSSMSFSSLDFYQGSCEYPYEYSVTASVSSANNIAVPVPVSPAPASNFLRFNNQTYQNVQTGKPAGFPATPNSIMLEPQKQCTLPNFWEGWHLVGSGGTLDYQSSTYSGMCVYQFGNTPYYWTAYGSGSGATPVWVQSDSVTLANSYQLPAFLYNVTVPAIYSSLGNGFSYYNSSSYIYSYHNVQSPGNYIDSFPLQGRGGVFANVNSILTLLSSDSFYGGSNYQGSSSPPGLNMLADQVIVPLNSIAATANGLTNVQQVSSNYSTAIIPNPVLMSESSNNNLFVVGSSGPNYYLYDVQLLPQGQFPLPANPVQQAATGYKGTSQGYDSMLSSYWSNSITLQSGQLYVPKIYSLNSIGSAPLAMASDYAGDTFILSANVVCGSSSPGCTPQGGTGFDISYIPANGMTVLSQNVVSGSTIPINGNGNPGSGTPLIQQFGYDIGPPVQISCGTACSTYSTQYPVSMALSPSGQYLYVAEQNLSYVQIYGVSTNNGLNVSYINAINLSYSTNLYNFSIGEYLKNGGPFASNGISDWINGFPDAKCQQNGVQKFNYYNDTPGMSATSNGCADFGVYHMPLGIATSGSALYVLDDWAFTPSFPSDSAMAGSILMLRAFYLNGTEIPMHASTYDTVLPKTQGLSLTTGYVAQRLYPPYGWPLSANFTIRTGSGSYAYISYCAYYCNNTPQYTSDPAGPGAIYAGYPPIGPSLPAETVQRSTQEHASAVQYAPPSPMSFYADFNNTVYIDAWSLWQIQANGANSCSPNPLHPYYGSKCFGSSHTYLQPCERSSGTFNPTCQLYTELLSVRMNVVNYTKASNASSSPPYTCYNLLEGGQACGYLNNGYVANFGVAPTPSSFTCYLGINANSMSTLGAPSSSPYLYSTPCTIVANLSLQTPPLIGMPNVLQYVEGLGSPENYISAQNLVNSYVGGGSGGGSGGGGGGSSQQYSQYPPTLSFTPEGAVYGQTINVIATCLGTDTCAVDFPALGDHVATGSPSAIYTVNTANYNPNQLTFYANDISGIYAGNWVSGTPFQSTSPTSIANIIGTAQNTISGIPVPLQFLIPSYLHSSISGALLIPYTYAYSVKQQWCAQGTGVNGIPCVDTLASTTCPGTTVTLPPQTNSYQVYTVQPAYSDSALNETIQGGPTIPQYQNWLKYYIANLSDQYLLSPPQLYFNIFTNRIFGQLYINQSVGPQGFSAYAPLPGGYYLPTGVVINATHLLNYSQVNFVQSAGPNQYPGYSVESYIPPNNNPITAHLNPTNAFNASWTVEYSLPVTLLGDVYAKSITVDSGVTLTTNGYALVATDYISNAGTILSGYADNGGNYGQNGGSLILSYGGSGGGGAASQSGICGGNGGATTVPGGPGACSAGSGGSPGSATQIPASLTSADLAEWARAIPQYLTGGGGGSSGSGAPGGPGAYGLYIQAPVLNLNPGTIELDGGAGSNGGGGGGGGILVLAYGSSLSDGTYQYAGGTGGTAPGGGGAVVEYQYPSNSVPIYLAAAQDQPTYGPQCGGLSFCSSNYYYNYLSIMQGNSIYSSLITPQLNIIQLFDALKAETQSINLQLNLIYNSKVLGYNRFNYTYIDTFNNTINMPLDVDLANITTINLNVVTTLNAINPNSTLISVSGTAGYYPSIFSATPSPVPAGSDIYLYYDTNINFYNTSNVIMPLSGAANPSLSQVYKYPANYIQYADICAFSSTAPCAFANPAYTTLPPVGQGVLGPVESNVITFQTQYNSLGVCSAEPNSLLLGSGTNTQECNIYGDFGLPAFGNTLPINGKTYPEYCIPYYTSGNGVLTSQLGLFAVVQTDQNGYFSNSFTACGTGTARVEASYYGFPAGQPVLFTQPPLQSPSYVAKYGISPFYYQVGSAHPVSTNTPMLNTLEYNYSISPNSSVKSFPQGTYYLSFGGITAWFALLAAGCIVSYILARGILPAKS